MPDQRLILCGGLQSGGSTLVSWCFLQRRDTDGILDMENSVIHTAFERVTAPVAWAKMTIGAFRWLDVAETYGDLGLEPEPLLVVRDVRHAYASLRRKPYGFDGLTAEEPPLRLRFRRFLLDWQLFQERGWPILVFERFLLEPEQTLRETCTALRLSFDEAMLDWPKPVSEVAYVLPGPNETFAASLEAPSLADAIGRRAGDLSLDELPERELRWLEETFAEYNRVHGYAERVECATGGASPSVEPPRRRSTPRDALADEVERLRRELLVRLDVEPVVPAGETFILVDNGFAAVHEGGRRSLPFPERDGAFNGHPADDREAIDELERLRRAGAGFIVFPERMRYWLEAYQGLREHLERSARRVVDNERCSAYDLR